MHVSITFTHLRGSRLPPNRSHPRGSLEGQLSTYMQSTRSGNFMVATLTKINDQVSPPLAMLYSVSLYTISPLGFHLRGLEKVGDGDGEAYVLQGWLVTTR